MYMLQSIDSEECVDVTYRCTGYCPLERSMHLILKEGERWEQYQTTALVNG